MYMCNVRYYCIFRVNRYQKQFSLDEKLERWKYEESKLDFIEVRYFLFLLFLLYWGKISFLIFSPMLSFVLKGNWYFVGAALTKSWPLRRANPLLPWFPGGFRVLEGIDKKKNRKDYQDFQEIFCSFSLKSCGSYLQWWVGALVRKQKG